MSYYVHNVPGRLRVKTPLVKGNPTRATQVEELLSSREGILSVVSNIVTGSVVINYDTTVIDETRILGLLESKGFFDPSRRVTADRVLDSAFSKGGQLVGKALLGIAMEVMFQGTPLSLLTVLI